MKKKTARRIVDEIIATFDDRTELSRVWHGFVYESRVKIHAEWTQIVLNKGKK